MYRTCVVIRDQEDRPIFTFDFYGRRKNDINPELIERALLRRKICPTTVRFLPLDIYFPRQGYQDTYPQILPPFSLFTAPRC